MANRARGEVEITVPKVGKVLLCLTMAGMAALEDAFEVESLQDAIAKIGATPSSKNLATVLHALTLGSDNGKEFTVEEIRRWAISPAVIKDAMAAMNASNSEGEGNE